MTDEYKTRQGFKNMVDTGIKLVGIGVALWVAGWVGLSLIDLWFGKTGQ